MRRLFVVVASISLIAGTAPAIAATAKAGAKCTKAGATAKSGSTTLVCTKSGSKLVWVKKVVAAPAPTPTPTPTPTQTPIAVGDWTSKPTSAAQVTDAASKAFDEWAATKRSTFDIILKLDPSTPADLAKWITEGVPFMAQRLPDFKIPNKYAAVAAPDTATFQKLMTDVYGASIADREKNAFGGSPAAAGMFYNMWNLTTIANDNLMVRDKVGMQQTAGHEYFHLLQNNVTGCGPCFNKVNETPQWFWEGPAVFMGIQTGRALGWDSYANLRQAFIDRYNNGGVTNTMLLKDVTVNDGKIDPYAIGMAATELLVSKIGVEKFINIYYEVGKGKSFADAFQSQAGISLADFFTYFESVRATLGFAKR